MNLTKSNLSSFLTFLTLFSVDPCINNFQGLQHQRMNTTGTNRADAGSNACTEREQAVQKLLLECEEQINLFEYEKALDICKEIYGLEPQNKETLLLESTILIELDQIEDAKNV